MLSVSDGGELIGVKLEETEPTEEESGLNGHAFGKSESSENTSFTSFERENASYDRGMESGENDDADDNDTEDDDDHDIPSRS
jgi:hypothetical protein